jgi:hypothetical protein
VEAEEGRRHSRVHEDGADIMAGNQQQGAAALRRFYQYRRHD